MLILPNGNRVGMISGGCLEGDLCRHAAALCEDGPRLISFDTRSDSINFNARYNQGCSGIIYVLVEPITKDSQCPLSVIRKTLETEKAMVVGTVYQSDGFPCFEVGARIDEVSSSASSQLQDIFEQVSQSGKPICCQLVQSASQENEQSARIFVERVLPPKPIWIFGAGDDAIPISNVARELGWAVTVIDDRAEFLTANRFPFTKRIRATHLEEFNNQLVPTPETAAILVSHSFTKDALLLPWLCTLDLAYVGLLGP